MKNNDTRDKNQYFNTDTGYFDEYIEELNEGLSLVDQSEITNAIEALLFTKKHGGRVFVAGNGGSSAIAEHLTCDIEKGCHVDSGAIATHCLSSNTALLTAIANDMGYEYTFSYQLETQTIKCVLPQTMTGNTPSLIFG